MSGYTPVFNTVFEGSLCGRYPDTAAWMFFLALADWKGEVDKTPEFIATITGMPLADLLGCVERFMQPDPRSRSQVEEGRKLALIDANRNWGWRVVNIQSYRDKASGREQVADGRNAAKVKRYRERHRQTPADTGRHPVTPTHTTDSDSDSDSDKNPEKKNPRSKTRARARSATQAIEFPETFVLDEPLRQQALSRSSDCDVEQAFEQFKAHHVTRGSTFKNWRSAWVTWIGNFEQFGYPKKRPVNGTKSLAEQYPGYKV